MYLWYAYSAMHLSARLKKATPAIIFVSLCDIPANTDPVLFV